MKRNLKTTIVLSTISLGVLHAANHCISAAATVRGLLNKHNGNYYKWRLGNIYYTKYGNGSPLLLLHDLNPLSSSYEWYELIQSLSKNHTVYTVDLLGCGRSDKPNLTYTNFLYVQMISDFIKQVIGEKTDVTASGLSGSCVLMACYINPELWGKIMLVNPESLTSLSRIPDSHSKIRKFVLDLPVIGTAVYHLITRRENVEYLFCERYFHNPFQVQKQYTDLYYESAHLGQSGGKYLLSSINGMYLNINIARVLSKINTSIFIVLGKHYEESNHIAQEYIQTNPSVKTEFIAGAKMLPQLETPDALYKSMSIFF